MKETTTTTARAYAYADAAALLDALHGPDALTICRRAALAAIRYKETADDITPDTADRLRAHDVHDVAQEAAARALDRIRAGKTVDPDTGEAIPGDWILSAAARAAVQRVVRLYYKRPTAALTRRDDAGREWTVIDTYARAMGSKATKSPEDAAAARAALEEIVQRIEARHPAARAVIAARASGYTFTETAARVGLSLRQVKTIAAAATEAARAIEEESRINEAARDVIDALRGNVTRAHAADREERAAAADRARARYEEQRQQQPPTFFLPEEREALTAYFAARAARTE